MGKMRTETKMRDFLADKDFAGLKPFDKKIWLSSPTMHGDEQRWVDEAIRTNWVSTVGANINEVEKKSRNTSALNTPSDFPAGPPLFISP